MSDDDETVVSQRLMRLADRPVALRQRDGADVPGSGVAGPRPRAGPFLDPLRHPLRAMAPGHDPVGAPPVAGAPVAGDAAAGLRPVGPVVDPPVGWPGADVGPRPDRLGDPPDWPWLTRSHTADPSTVGRDTRRADPPTTPARPLAWEAEADPPADPSAGAPPSRLGGAGAFDPGRRGVKALAAVAAVVVVAAAGWAWWARPREEPVVSASMDPAGVDAPADSAVAPAATEVVVAVAGRVHRPGLVRLPAGSRVADALTAVGGALPGVDVALLNLARKLVDGELILVGVTAPPGVPGAAGNPAGGDTAGAAPGGRLNLNTATLAQLDALPGVGPVLAQRILDARERRGGFRSVGDLRQVDGIGESRYEELKDLVTV
ncbi:helix-hairpin-helix domain-containing protein [Polymorphospora rubra]|uniref:helix-hairpin-helix domain-containing protein n=1 Tax=Polymorphospora rubra TaxID=338584 RepID=UPI003F4CB070